MLEFLDMSLGRLLKLQSIVTVCYLSSSAEIRKYLKKYYSNSNTCHIGLRIYIRAHARATYHCTKFVHQIELILKCIKILITKKIVCLCVIYTSQQTTVAILVSWAT